MYAYLGHKFLWIEGFRYMMRICNYIRENYGVTFPLTPCDFSAPTAFGVSGYPTTVIIDKYGVIREVEVGARIYASYWKNLFLGYADDK